MNEFTAHQGTRIVHKLRGPSLPDVALIDRTSFHRPLSEEDLRHWYEENRLAGVAYVRVLTNRLAARYGAWVDSQGQVRALEPVPGDGPL